MTKTKTGGRIALCASAAFLAVPQAAEAQSQKTASIDLQGSAGYSTNPFLFEGGDGGGFGRVSALGNYSITTERSSTVLSAFVENSTYTNGQGSKQLANVALSERYSVSPTLNLFGGAGFSVDFGSQLSTRFLDNSGAIPTTPPEVIIDPALFNRNRRSYRVNGNIGATFRVSERDDITLSGADEQVFYDKDSRDLNVNVASAQASWNRRVDERTGFGARLSGQEANYHTPGESASVYSLQATLNRQVAEGWSATIAAGATYAIRRSITGDSHSVGPAVDANICHTSPQERFCGQVSRSVQTALGQDALTQTSVGADYYRKLNANDTIQARAGLTHFGSRADSPKINYVSAGVNYNHRFSDRLSGGGDLGVRDLYQRGRDVPFDVTGLLFIRYRIGDIAR